MSIRAVMSRPVGALATTLAEVRSGSSYLSHNDMRVHFGLGGSDRVTRLEIRWPSGLVETVDALPADRFYVAREGQGVQPSRSTP